MPRHAKKDVQATREAKFVDRRSFVTMPSIYDGKAHLRLYGADVSAARERACDRATVNTLGGPIARCQEQGCGRRVRDDVPDYAKDKAEMDHIERRRGMRCDCDENLQMICKECHDKKHGH